MVSGGDIVARVAYSTFALIGFGGALFSTYLYAFIHYLVPVSYYTNINAAKGTSYSMNLNDFQGNVLVECATGIMAYGAYLGILI